jgi:hypothetical protein
MDMLVLEILTNDDATPFSKHHALQLLYRCMSKQDAQRTDKDEEMKVNHHNDTVKHDENHATNVEEKDMEPHERRHGTLDLYVDIYIYIYIYARRCTKRRSIQMGC